MEPVTLRRPSRVRWLARVPGQRDDERFGLVRRGLAMPPGGLSYLVSDAGARKVRVVAYIDRFGRVFMADAPLDMPPATEPDLALRAYERDAGEADGDGPLRVPGAPGVSVKAPDGCVEIAVPRGKPLRVGEFVRTRSRYELVASRVELGDAAAGLDLAGACAVSYLAFCHFPQREGVSLVSSSVRSVLMRLKQRDLFAALRDVYDQACAADSHPRVHAPGAVRYLARMLRDADLVGITAADVAPDEGEELPVEFEVDFGDGFVRADAADLAGLLGALFGAAGIELPPFQAGDRQGATALPEVALVRTVGYANTFYAAFDRASVGRSGLARIYEAEGVLNRFLFLVEELDRLGRVQSATERECAAVDLSLFDAIGDRAFGFVDGALSAGDGAREDPFDDSDLAIRISFARAAEGLRLPYRIEYNMGFSPAEGTLALDVTAPTASVMPRFAPDGDDGWRALGVSERNALAAAYAARVSAIAAAMGFSASGRVRRTVVNVWHVVAPGEERCVLSVPYDRAGFFDDLGGELGAGPRGFGRRRFMDDPLAFVARSGPRLAFGGQGELSAVEPVVALGSIAPERGDPEVPPDTDARPLDPASSRALHARTISDLGIYEEAGRKRLASSIVEAFERDGDLGGIAAARDASSSTADALVRGACLKVCDGISRGSITVGDAGEITRTLTDVYGLKAAMEEATRLLRVDPKASRARLEAIVASCELDGWFADTDEACHRYFDSYAARAVYALRCADADARGRGLRLVADEYFLAHYRLSTMLADSLDDCETAIGHARRCVQLAPSVANGYLRLARCYFSTFDYASEVATLKDMLRIAWNPSEVGMALYWMGYALWLTGDGKTGAACYQKCVEFDRDLARTAAAEAAEFCARDGVEHRQIPSKEVDAILGAAGIDLPAVQENAEFIVRAAASAVEAGSYTLGRALLGSATLYFRDDALAPVIESLRA